MRLTLLLLAGLFAYQSAQAGDSPAVLKAKSFRPDKGTVFLFANWGRVWQCGRFENAQLQEISFARLPYTGTKEQTLSLTSPSRLFVKNEWIPYAFALEPGEYALASFDLKVAASVKDVKHMKPTAENLIKEGKALGGKFSVAAGEIVYIGNFYVDCATPDPIPWRYYSTREEFAGDVAAFRKRYPFTEAVPIQYRLFETEVIGNMVGVEEYSVK